MDWTDFLIGKSEEWRLTPDQAKVFQARLATAQEGASEASIATCLNLSVAAVKKHMNAVYDCAAREFPSLQQIQGRGKLTELRACLKQAWKATAPTTAPAAQSASQPVVTSRYGIPMPKLRLPENFVPRPEALNAVKQLLLAEDGRTLVVSAISGLGGLGKSVLAAAIVLDDEVQGRFSDGILWVTLGQNPDLQTMLGDWIRELDKSREAFSANTLESASGYLHSLLAERRMLLVVDDVWNAEHAEHFRVGGAGCRVLVTTREARIEGADGYALGLMSPGEAVELVQKKLGRQWRPEQEPEVKTFAKLLGYLPLALDLAASQVRDGLSWAELRAEFEVERRAVALEVLDQSEAWERLSEEQQRKYSLRACFNLSLRRLKPEQLRQFAWLGVLPEDVNLNRQVATVLWDLPALQAKQTLVLLRNRSFLTDGVATAEGEPTYRVHDLMHDMARSRIEAPVPQGDATQLGGLGLTLAEAHRQFLERYRERTGDRRWNKLPNDGYIHRHLSWHLEQADWANELHALLAMSDNLGRNAWFEACDRIGQPAIFVEDVARAWKLAEQTYVTAPTESIVLQCRYALITATLNSLISNLPIGMMAEFVKRQFWTIEQAWAYVEQMQEEDKIAEAIEALAPYLSKSLFQVAVDKARLIQDEYQKAKTLSGLAQVDRAYFTEALKITRLIQEKSSRAWVLSRLAKIDRTYLTEALQAARLLQEEYDRAQVLSHLAQVDRAYFTEALETARLMQDESSRAWVLSSLAQIDKTYFTEALEITQLIQGELSRAQILSRLAQVDGADFAALLQAAQLMQDESNRALALSSLAQIDKTYFTEALEAARLIQNEYGRTLTLNNLTQIDGANFATLLEVARLIQDESSQARVLRSLAQIDRAYFAEALEVARLIQGKSSRAHVLGELAQIDMAYFTEALEVVRLIQDESSQARVLSSLVQIDRAYFTEALEAARLFQGKSRRAHVLGKLAQIDMAYFTEALEAARLVQDNLQQRAWALSNLAQIDRTYLTEALEAARLIQNEYGRTLILSSLAQIDRAYFTEALEAARLIQDELHRADALSNLAQIDRAYFTEALEAARLIQNESMRAGVLSSLIRQASQGFLPNLWEAMLELSHKPTQAEVLSAFLSRLSLATLPHSDWQSYLHLLAHRKRAELMQDLATLYPAICHLGGEAAMRGVVEAMREVCGQWK